MRPVRTERTSAVPEPTKQVILVFTQETALEWSRFLVDAAQRLPEREDRATLRGLAELLADLGMS